MREKFNIAGYCRISVDDEQDKFNTSIENQRAIITDFVKRKFPGSTLTFYEDRDRSGYTFEQREGYQEMRGELLNHKYDIMIINDLSRFSRRNGRGLVELEDLRDAGVRIMSIHENIDYPTNDDWMSIQIHFFVNEMPVTETSKKVRNVIKHRQNDGKWICSVPYGYVITNSKNMTFEVDEAAAQVVRMVFDLYNEGLGYKKIANRLTDLKIPTPRMMERERKEAKGEECRLKAKPEWSIVTIQGILENDFYIGTLRQGKYVRKKINGADIKKDAEDHIVFENNHPPIVDFRVFAVAQEQHKQRTKTNYRGVRVNENMYSGFIVCGDCGSPMFSMSRRDLHPAYTCGSYHQRGLKGCTAHHTRVDVLDKLLKSYVERVRGNSAEMIVKLEQSIKDEKKDIKTNEEVLNKLQELLDGAKEELKATKRQKVREIVKNPDREEMLEEVYSEMESELEGKIEGFQNQITMSADKRNTVIKVNRIAKTAIDIFNDILGKEKLDRVDLNLIIDKIIVFEDHLEIKLKSDIDALLQCKTVADNVNFPHDIINIENRIVVSARNRKDKVYDVNVISNSDPLEIYTDHDGEVIFKKYSPIGELSNFSTQYADVLHKTCGLTVLVTDKDYVISASGVPKKEVFEKRISSDIENVMENRINYKKDSIGKALKVVDGLAREALVAVPVISESDVIGCVVVLANDQNHLATETDMKLAQTAAGFFGRQMEN